ncbi:DUF5999 family protein [Streptomyces ramulosus]|uniref:DUF5999 family protein n=1 Tax=Streptomyces ramulosus TaxID=47762 RepID=A0ABW1FBJ4_9ACTN
MCAHSPSGPSRPAADSADRDAARPVAAHPERGRRPLGNGVALFGVGQAWRGSTKSRNSSKDRSGSSRKTP